MESIFGVCESSAFNVIYLVDTARYERTARLSIVPSPDVILRVFMAFRRVTWAYMPGIFLFIEEKKRLIGE